MVAVPRGKESESAGLHPLLNIGESHLEAISRITPTQLRGRQRFSHVTPTEFIRVCSFALILSALAVYGLTEKAKSDASDLAKIHAGQTAVALDYQGNERRQALINAFTATPTETSLPTLTETPTPTTTATAEPTREPTKIPPTPTEEPIDRYPDEVKKGELPKQLKPFDSPEQATQASIEQGKPIIPLIFLNYDSVEMKKMVSGSNAAYKVTTPDQTLLLSLGNGDIIDDATYQKMMQNYFNLKKSGKLPKFLLVITTDSDLETQPSPPAGYVLKRSVRNVQFIDDGSEITRKEIGISFSRSANIEWFKHPGDKASPLEPVLMFKDSPPDPENLRAPDPANTFRFGLSEYTDTGGYSTNASFESFAQIENRTGYLPLASSK